MLPAAAPARSPETHVSPPLRRVLYALFTLPSVAGLICESVWSHYLELVLGHAAHAKTLVLAIFTGGVALRS
ncbi:MAG TPA: hypothetical protein VF331_13490 [Polyangiales bacterium]